MPRSEAPPAIAIIILNWNDAINTIACIHSLHCLDYPNYKIYVIDNNSQDNSISIIQKEFPNIDIHNSGANLGWAGGNNFGIKVAQSDLYQYFYLVNPDIRVRPTTLTALVGGILSDQVAAVGSLILSYNRPDWLEFAGAALDPATGFSRQISMNKSEFAPSDTVIELPEIKGCSFLITAAGFDRCGYFDARYFLNYDETDWCFRARSLGLTCVLATDSICSHLGAVSFAGSNSPLYRYFIARNRILFARKNLPASSIRFSWRCLAWEFKSTLFGQSGEKLTLKQKTLVLLSLLYVLRDAAWHRHGDCPPMIRTLNQLFRKSR